MFVSESFEFVLPSCSPSNGSGEGGPKSVSDSAKTQVDNGLTGLGASQLIKSLLEEKEKNEPVAKEPSNEFEAPF